MKWIWLALFALAGCTRQPVATAPSPCDIALAPSNDPRIARLQRKDRLEQLGWAYVEKARQSFDPGYYKLAEQCALCMGDGPDAMLLRGHALHNLHKFKEAEAIARELVAKRARWMDYALLGDCLMEQGRLDEAIPAYQAMMDQKPGPEAYARAAHVRWLKGDLTGAIELMRLTGNDPWMRTRRAKYEMQAGLTNVALPDDYPPALLLRGDLESLQRAARMTMLPEYLWALADAQRAAGKPGEAEATEAALRQHGMDDPRTYSLFLATRGENVELAARLAQEELQNRQDVFTYDALAWALFAAGRRAEARAAMQRALAEGTQDARLALHAAAIFGNNQTQTQEKQQ